MAGIDKDYTGEAWPGENVNVGYLEQEPQLDATKTVLENVTGGVGGRGLLAIALFLQLRLTLLFDAA